MKRLVASFFGVTFTLVIIQIAIVCILTYGTNTTLAEALRTYSVYEVREIQIGNQTQVFYLFNARTYTNTIRSSIEINFLAFDMDIPEWAPLVEIDSIELLWTAIKDVFFYVINWVIFIVNVTVMVPTKLLLSPIIFLMAITGMDLSKIPIFEAIQKIYSFNISYI